MAPSLFTCSPFLYLFQISYYLCTKMIGNLLRAIIRPSGQQNKVVACEVILIWPSHKLGISSYFTKDSTIFVWKFVVVYTTEGRQWFRLFSIIPEKFDLCGLEKNIIKMWHINGDVSFEFRFRLNCSWHIMTLTSQKRTKFIPMIRKVKSSIW